MGAGFVLPVVMARLEGRVFTPAAGGFAAAGALMIAGGVAAVAVGRKRRDPVAMPAGVRATLLANIVFLAFFALELCDRVVRQEGRVFYWSTFLFPLAALLFCGLIGGRRWAWWMSRGLFSLGTIWFLVFILIIPFAHLQTEDGPTPWYGRLYMAALSLGFAGILGYACRSLGARESRQYFGEKASDLGLGA